MDDEKRLIIIGIVLLALIGCISQSEPQKQKTEYKPQPKLGYEEGDGLSFRINNYGVVDATGCEIIFSAKPWGEISGEFNYDRHLQGRISVETTTDTISLDTSKLPKGK